MRHHRHQHAGQLHVLRVEGAAVALGGAVDVRQAMLADQPEAGRVLERHVLGHGRARGGLGQLAEAGAASRGRVAEHALGHLDRVGRHLPALCGGLHQHGARGGAGAPHGFPRIEHGGAAAGALQAAQRLVAVARAVGRGALDAHLAPIGVELLGQQRGQAGIGSLAHLQVLGQDGDPAVGADAHEGVGGETVARLRAGGHGAAGQRRQRQAQQQAAGALHETAPAQVLDGDAHDDCSLRPGPRRRRGWRRGCARTWRNGRYCRSWRRRCRGRWGRDWRAAGRRRT
ncbi:Uncharacterised protein [Bordetella pertussis]|nr:Uncharacterised protein [Bordetella pertussis]CFL86945.1 Uncharacterised protein [Bordetella pertussis]CFM37782.1 Uncharacterised protein [Bordetella pertussis]CFN24001.1 Uncharacterised protein [Bordetella pertussis]CFN74433.1 Uncharacterised protein [Bordetella pertussis]